MNKLLRQGLSFSEALNYIKRGYLCARQGWNGDDMFVFLVPGSTFQVNRHPLLGVYPEGTTINYQPHIDMRTADGTIVPWLASQSDLLTDDWTVLEDENYERRKDPTRITARTSEARR